jgi:hypothetical protein
MEAIGATSVDILGRETRKPKWKGCGYFRTTANARGMSEFG